MSKKPDTDRNTYNSNRAIEAAFHALDKCRHTCAMLGHPIRSLSMSVDDENERHCKVRYFKIPKSEKVIERMRK